MASELRVTTIANNAGSESVNTTYVVNGSAKNFTVYNGSTNAINDSLNTSSLTDIGSGNHKVTYTSSMSGNKYCAGGTMCYNGDNTTYVYSTQPINENDVLAASVEYVTAYADPSNSGVTDYTTTMSTVHGDLA